jgi:hypothetical protein
MEEKIDLSDDLATELHRRAPHPSDRSVLVGRILKAYFKSHPQPAPDIDIINSNEESLNREAMDVLDYQSIP